MAKRTGYPDVLAIVLAGGEGRRLMPLTADRAKPAVPFGGIYRLIDFALSNVVNSGYLKIVVLTQYKSHSLDRHISKTWRMSTMLGNYVTPVPAQQRIDKSWFQGSADAIFQSLNLVHDQAPDIIVVTGADHVYRMDFSHMVEQHIDNGVGVTLAAIRQPISLADQFGVIEVDAANPPKIRAFLEKPKDATGLADSPQEVLVSMGAYVFDAEALIDAVTRDAERPGSRRDMGGDIVPDFVDRGEAYVYDMKDNPMPGSTDRDHGYWRDVGSIDSYYDAQMELVDFHPVFNLYNYEWPIYTDHGNYPPAKFVHGSRGRVGSALNSAVSPGVVVSGAQVTSSVLSPGVHIHSYATVTDSVLLDFVEVGRKATILRAIIDKFVVVPPGVSIGVNHAHDLERGFTVTDSGITVVGKRQEVLP
jgi:glucose-1-phosphate adenylyltransferase